MLVLDKLIANSSQTHHKRSINISIVFFFVLLAPMILAVTQKTFAQKGGDVPLDYCCAYITVTTQITNDCCVEITVSNPYCDSVIIYFDKLNPGSGNYETKHIAPSGAGSVVTYKMCPENRESPLRYRVRISRYERYEPACHGAWVEGRTQFSGEVDLTQCCNCPENPVSDWFILTVERDPSCPDSSCKVKHHLNIPDSITCYKYYEYYGSGGYHSGQITPGFISDLDFCIPFGQTATASIHLKRSETDDTPCYLVASARCDTLTPEPPLKEPCTPDCPETPFNNFGTLENYSIPGCPGCSVKVNYTWRRACPIGFQDLQILNIQLLSPECNNCPIEEIYKQALLRIIWNNEMGFDPKTNDTCSTIWRIVQGGCWVNWIYIISDFSSPYLAITVWEPCDSTECCLQPMTVCRYEWGIKIIPGEMYNQVDTCTMWKIHPVFGNPIPCKPHCEWLMDLGGDYVFEPRTILPGQPETERLDKITISDFKDIYGFRASNTNSEFVVFVRAPESSDMTVEISDLLGNTLISSTYQISRGETHKTIDISKLRTGVYTFSVSIKGKKLWTGKFSVTR